MHNYESLSQHTVNFPLSGTQVPSKHLKENLPHTKHFKSRINRLPAT